MGERTKSDENKRLTLKAGVVPNNPEIFLGRDEDINLLKIRLGIGGSSDTPTPTQVLTAVHGWPGIGKTSFATVLANDSEVQKKFTDGVFWVSLGQKPNLIRELAIWGRNFGLEKDILNAYTVKEAIQLLHTLFRQKQALLVVDDVWQTDHAEIFRQIRGNDCALVLTTRIELVINELNLPANVTHKLPSLTEKSAIKLLTYLAPTIVKDYLNESLQLLKEVECLPLAIHVAGRLLNTQANRGFDVLKLFKDLQQGFLMFKAKAPHNMINEAGEIPTVAALFHKSTDLLEESTKHRFGLLGLFAAKPATFDLEAIKALWQIQEIEPTLDILIDYGLLERNGSRYQMHQLIAKHAKSLLKLRSS